MSQNPFPDPCIFLLVLICKIIQPIWYLFDIWFVYTSPKHLWYRVQLLEPFFYVKNQGHIRTIWKILVRTMNELSLILSFSFFTSQFDPILPRLWPLDCLMLRDKFIVHWHWIMWEGQGHGRPLCNTLVQNLLFLLLVLSALFTPI